MKRTWYLSLLLLTGCSAAKPPQFIRALPEPAPTKPWSDGQVATYWLGRTTAGPDGLIIHEAHPVYRLEGAAQPQLAPPPACYYPTNVAALGTNAAYEQYEVLRAEVARTRDLTRKLIETSQDLAQRAVTLRNTMETNRQWQEQLSQTVQAAAALSNRVQTLEQRGGAPEPRPKP